MSNNDAVKNNISEFLKSSGILVVANLVIKAVQFFLMPLYTKYLSPEELGVNDLIVTTTGVILPLLTLALDASFSAFYYDKGDNTKERTFNTIHAVLMIQSLIPLVLCFLSKPLSSLLFKTDQYYWGVIVAMLGLSINLLFMPYALKLRLENRMQLFSIINVIASVFMLVSNIVFVVGFKLGYISLIYSHFLTNLVQLLLYWLLPKYRFEKKYVSKDYARTLIRYGLPLVPNAVFSWILVSCDRYMISGMCGEAEVGIYGIGMRFLTILNIIINAVNMAYTTFAFKNKGEEYARSMYSAIFVGMSFLLMGGCFTVSVFAKDIIHVMVDPRYYSAYVLIAPLLYSQTAMACNNIAGYGISFTKKSRYFLISSVIAAVVNVVLNYILVKYYASLGAAVATMISHIVLFVITYCVAQKLYRVDYKVVKTAICFFATFAIAMLVVDQAILIKVAVYVVVVAVALYAYRGEIKEAKEMFTGKR